METREKRGAQSVGRVGRWLMLFLWALAGFWVAFGLAYTLPAPLPLRPEVLHGGGSAILCISGVRFIKPRTPALAGTIIFVLVTLAVERMCVKRLYPTMYDFSYSPVMAAATCGAFTLLILILSAGKSRSMEGVAENTRS